MNHRQQYASQSSEGRQSQRRSLRARAGIAAQPRNSDTQQRRPDSQSQQRSQTAAWGLGEDVRSLDEELTDVGYASGGDRRQAGERALRRVERDLHDLMVAPVMEATGRRPIMPLMRILLAEDDRGLREVLVQGLEEKGYLVDAVDRGDDAIEQMKFYEYDVAILDWRMPGTPGIDVVSWARRNQRPTAIIMLTARDTPPDRIQGLDAGADDYLVKPFDFGELIARIRALQRRPRGVEAPIIRRGALALDPVRREVLLDGRHLALTPSEFNILELLLRRHPAVVDRKAIAEHAWRDETEPLGSNVIDVKMSRLRAKLVNSGTRIVTVRGAGFRLEEG